MYNHKIGERIKDLRKARGMTQQVLADRLGITKSVISAYENATAYPQYDNLIGIADIFSVSADYLLGRQNKRNISTEGLTEDQIDAVSILVNQFQKANKA